MFFQISPVRRPKPPKPVVKEAEPQKVEVLSLGPFAPSPKLYFDGVKVGETATCKLLLRNPTKQDITLFLTKKLPEELNVAYSWESNTVERESEILFEIFWKPLGPESSYHKIRFESIRGTIHRDVPVAFKSVSPKRPKVDKKSKHGVVTRKSPPRKSPTKKYYNTKPPYISTKRFSPSPKKHLTTLKKNVDQRFSILSPPNQYKDIHNYTQVKGRPVIKEPFDCENATYIDRRGTYVFERNPSPNFNDSLESPEKLSKLSTPEIFHKRAPLTPSLFDVSTPATSNFAYKLTHMESLCFSPYPRPVNLDKENFDPQRTSTDKKKDRNLSLELPANLSSETYVKGNVSFETYVKGNISGETYTKDSSIGRLESLSPLSIISPSNYRRFSPPTSLKSFRSEEDPKTFNSNILDRMALTSIQEESFSQFKNSFSKKKSDLDLTVNFAKPGGGFTGPRTWSKKGSTAYRISKSSTGLNLSQITAPTAEKIKTTAINTTHTIEEEATSQILKRDTNTVIIQNPFLLAATNMVDPFVTPHLYVSEEWLERQENDFKKWLNSLLTPPQELLSEDKVVDVAKVWQECKKREVEAAPTKEDISNKYHVNAKLNCLRKAAQNLFRSKEMGNVLSKVLLAVDSGKLSLRQDKDVHLNLSIRSDIMKVILNYNPLWLRIGLETIYNEIIPLHSNSDLVGLSTFMLNRLFKDPYLTKKYKSVLAPRYIVDFNKFFLKKFLTLVYFLDQAKIKKLIPHNPCLFSKTGTIKESREFLLILARELLSAVGDITKFLKFSGYVVSHVQTYIHEFDYAVNNLGVDLRDGVRLTKVMEIILMEDDLTSNLRVPAISRLQKVHNMKLVFDSLEKAGYKILYDISPKDIVDGHREKTMSFLWQIIYKFEAPLMVKHATTIQTWFRSLPVILKRRKLQRIRLERENAVNKIQNWYKRQVLSRKLTAFAGFLKQYLHRLKLHRNAVKIQSFYRMYKQRKLYSSKILAIKGIQKFSRGWLIRNSYMNRIKSAVKIQSCIRMFLARKAYLKVKIATQTLQSWYRSCKQTKKDEENYRKIKRATLFIQRKWKATMMAKRQKAEFKMLKLTVLNIQMRFYANKLCKIKKERYQTLRNATIKIQCWYRSIKMMKTCRQEYLILKQTVLIVEKRYISVKLMKKDHENYKSLRKACITIQQKYRAQKEMKVAKQRYVELRAATIVLQRRFTAKILMQKHKAYYRSLKLAAITLQSHYRAKLAMKIDRVNYLSIKNASIKIQTWLRAVIQMRKCRKEYLSTKNAVKLIENKYQAQKLMKTASTRYQSVRKSAIIIQRRFRALLAMRKCKEDYAQLKLAATSIQARFRANKAAKIQRNEYLNLKKAVIVLQANQKMLKCRKDFDILKNATLAIQRRYRANQMMKIAKKEYQELVKYTVTIQQQFRANRIMKLQRNDYFMLKNATVILQARFRAKQKMEECKKSFESLKKAAIVIQRRYRARKLMQKAKKDYQELLKHTVVVQRIFRANKAMTKQRKEYLELKKATTTLQTQFRAKLKMEECRNKFEKSKNAALLIQRRYRAKKLMEEAKKDYQQLRKCSITIQRLFRANKVMKFQRNKFLELKQATVCIQTNFRANQQMKKCKNHYDSIRASTLVIQRRLRAKKLMEEAKNDYQELRKYSITIQRLFRANKAMKEQRNKYLELKRATICIQTRFRANQKMQQCKNHYDSTRASTLVIQRRYRAKKLMEKTKKSYQELLKYTIIIQRQFRANKAMKIQRSKYLEFKNSTVIIQTRFRAIQKMHICKKYYDSLRAATLVIQKSFRANQLMKKFKLEYQELLTYTITVQRLFRAKQYMIIEKTKYVTLRETVMRIQARWRANKLCKEHREDYLRLKKSTLTIQQRWRAFKIAREQRTRYENLRKRTIFIQQRWRAKRLGQTIRREYLALKKLTEATVFVQQKFRANIACRLARNYYQKLKAAVLVIQRRYRANVEMKLERNKLLKLKKSSMSIQTWFKAILIAKKLRKQYLLQKNCAIEIQRFARGYLTRKKYADYFTEDAREKRKIEKTEKEAAVKIQSLWRGYKARSREHPEMKQIRQRYIKARATAEPERTIKFKCNAAVQTFVHTSSTLFHVIKALEDIDYATRRCKQLCITIAKLLTEEIYCLVSATTRSLPEMNACISSVNILINFNKLKETKELSFVPAYIGNLVAVMMHWCDKESQLFPSLCTLFWLFAHTPQWRRFILNLPNIKQKLEKIKGLVLRKSNMVQRQAVKGNSVFINYKNLPVPSLFPDWGLNYKSKPFVFTNSVHAFSSLLAILNM